MPVTDPVVVERGLKANFVMGYEARMPQYPNMVTEIPSSAKDEKYAWLGTVPTMEEWKSERKLHGLLGHSFTIVNNHYATGIEVDSDDLDDDQVGALPLRAQDLGTRARRHPDDLLTTLIAAGEAAGGECYDGQFFFDTDHAEGDSGNQSNDLGYTVSSTTAVTQAEFEGAFVAALVAMLNFKDDRGQPYLEEWSLDASNLTILVPPALWDVALKSMETDLISNTTNVHKGRARVIVNSRLSSTVKWYLLYNGSPVRPFIFQNRQPIRTGFLGLDSDGAFSDRMVKFGVDARYNMGYGLWQYAVLTTFAT